MEYDDMDDEEEEYDINIRILRNLNDNDLYNACNRNQELRNICMGNSDLYKRYQKTRQAIYLNQLNANRFGPGKPSMKY